MYLVVASKEDKRFYPSAVAAWCAWGSLAVFTGLTALLILARVFRIEFFRS